MGLRCAFVPIFEGRHYHLGPICIKSEEFFSLLLYMLRQKLLHLLKIQIAPGWRDGRMLTIFKSVTSTTFQLSNFYNEQWDTTELMNLGQSRGIITWALWKELSTTQDDNFSLVKKQNFIQVSWMRYLHLQIIIMGFLKNNI